MFSGFLTLLCGGHFIPTGEFGGELACGCSFGSDSGVCGVAGSTGSVLGSFSSLCLLSSNIKRRRSSWVDTRIVKYHQPSSKISMWWPVSGQHIWKNNHDTELYLQRIPICTKKTWHSPMLQTRVTNTQTSAGCFLGPSRGSRVGVSDQTAVSNAVCPGWLAVSASVSHGRWLTLSLSSFSLSALASLSFFSISTRSNRVGLQEELDSSVNQRKRCVDV